VVVGPSERRAARRGFGGARLDGRVAQRHRARVRYANITIIEGNEASQFGIGIVSARIAEAVLRNERAVLPIGAYNAGYGVTLSLPSVVGREGVSRILQPAMSDEERRSLAQSAEVLRQALQRMLG